VIVELRQYSLRPGQWDVLADLFERVLAQGQEAVGMSIIGWFRDVDRPDRFVWLRSFRDMPDRARALAAFYGGPVWAEHRDAANATMIDSDNVLLLRPAGRRSSLVLERFAEPIVVSIHQFPTPVAENTVERFDRELGPAWAAFVTEESPNDFPALPVREGEHVVVRLSGQIDAGAQEVLRLQP
jgi:hypothetical protein